MKKISTLFLLLSSLSLIKAQVKSSVLLKAADQAVSERKTGDDKQSFAGTLGAIGNFVGQDGNGITFQPTIYGIASLIKSDLAKPKNYEQAKIIRNIQLNLTLNTAKSIFKYDSIQIGFTYAILNNKKLKVSDYDQLNASKDMINSNELRDILNKYLGQHLVEPLLKNKLISLIKNEKIRASDFDGLPSDLTNELKNQIGATDSGTAWQKVAAQQLNAPDSVYKEIIEALTKKTLVTADVNSIRNIVDKQWQGFSVASNYYQYFFKKSKKSPAMNLKVTYIISRDSAETTDFSKQTLKVDWGINFPLMINQNKEPILEVKPGVKYTNVTHALHEKELNSKLKPSVTVRYKVNKNFFLPLTIDYDPKNANFLGFLSIQYSLK